MIFGRTCDQKSSHGRADKIEPKMEPVNKFRRIIGIILKIRRWPDKAKRLDPKKRSDGRRLICSATKQVRNCAVSLSSGGKKLSAVGSEGKL